MRGQRRRAGTNRTVEHDVQREVDEEEEADDNPDPRKFRHDRAAPQQSAREPGDEGLKLAAESAGSDDDGVTAGREAGRGLQPAPSDEQVLADPRAFRDPRAAADHDQRPADDRSAPEPPASERADPVAI